MTRLTGKVKQTPDTSVIQPAGINQLTHLRYHGYFRVSMSENSFHAVVNVFFSTCTGMKMHLLTNLNTR
jgi:hypothetical protein